MEIGAERTEKCVIENIILINLNERVAPLGNSFLWVGGWVGDLNQDERDSRMGHDRNSRLLGG